MRTDEDYTRGILISEEHKYLKCLKFGYRDLQQLFRQDESYWEENKGVAQQRKAKVSKQMEDIIDENQRKLKQIMMEE